MTIARYSLIALLASLSLVSAASAQVYEAAARIEGLAHQLEQGIPTELHGSRFAGALSSLAGTMENEAQDILRLSTRHGDMTHAILANANSIRRLALRSNELLNQVELDLRLGRGHVHGNPAVARRVLAEIDRLAGQIALSMTYSPDSGFGLPGGTVIHRHTTSYGSGYGGYYDDRFVRSSVVTTAPSRTGLWLGGTNWGISLGR